MFGVPYGFRNIHIKPIALIIEEISIAACVALRSMVVASDGNPSWLVADGSEALVFNRHSTLITIDYECSTMEQWFRELNAMDLLIDCLTVWIAMVLIINQSKVGKNTRKTIMVRTMVDASSRLVTDDEYGYMMVDSQGQFSLIVDLLLFLPLLLWKQLLPSSQH